jgi:uncharacterized protein YjbI with pentapeptide repeats
MKPIASCVIAAALALLATPALAQNAGQIAKAKGGASCAGCNLFQADMSGVEVSGRNYSRARLRQSDMSLAVMTRANFTGADLRDADAFGGVFTGASFAGADMGASSWVGAHFGGADLRGAKLSGADFSGAELAEARGLTQAQLNAACGDASTTLPAGMSVRACR